MSILTDKYRILLLKGTPIYNNRDLLNFMKMPFYQSIYNTKCIVHGVSSLGVYKSLHDKPPAPAPGDVSTLIGFTFTNIRKPFKVEIKLFSSIFNLLLPL